jgi:hypothetical protein
VDLGLDKPLAGLFDKLGRLSQCDESIAKMTAGILRCR